VLPYAEEALKTDPDQVDALRLEGEALRRLHRYDEAKEPYRHLTSLPGAAVIVDFYRTRQVARRAAQ
jgi:hypothetical protein